MQTPLKWAGGKRWLVSHLEPYWQKNKNRRLVEPFCGAASVSFGLDPKTALLNDNNPHLINFFVQLQNGLRIDFPLINEEESYYQTRARFNSLIREGIQNQETAGLFYYLNRTCYNGLCRFNSRGEFNVPFGRYKKISYIEDFSSYMESLGSWKFKYGDFQRIEILPGDFVYVDPPYDGGFQQYSKEGFSWDNQVRLSEWLDSLDAHVVIASNKATERIINLYTTLGFDLCYLNAPRRISSTGNRDKVREILAIKV